MKKVLALVLAVAMLLSMASFAVADELPTITIMFHGSNVTDDKEVLEKVNAYIADKVGAQLSVVWGTWGDFDEKSVNALVAGDPIDMYFTCSWSADEYNKFAKEGYWLKLDDLMAEYAPEYVAMLPKALMDGATVEGAEGKGVYAFNGYKDTGLQNCWDVNVTLLKELGFTLDDVKGKSFYEFGDLFAKAKEVKGENFYPFLVEPMVLERMVTNSMIVTGDNAAVNLLSYYINPENVGELGAYGNVILNKFATEEYKKFVEKMREYYLAGYVNPGVAVAETANDVRNNGQLQGDYLISTQSYAFGFEYNEAVKRGIELAYVPTTDPYMDTATSQGALVAVSSTTEHAVECVKFLNLLNTDPTLMTLLNYGVEGVHYTLENGLVKFTEKRNDYAPWTNGMGNVNLLPSTVEEGEGFRERFAEFYSATKALPILGYIFNPDNVKVEVAALSNVGAQYALALDAGAVDPAATLPEFLAKLDEAGMQKYLDEANAQLQSFLGK